MGINNEKSVPTVSFKKAKIQSKKKSGNGRKKKKSAKS